MQLSVGETLANYTESIMIGKWKRQKNSNLNLYKFETRWSLNETEAASKDDAQAPDAI